jgi:hypothetical protein
LVIRARIVHEVETDETEPPKGEWRVVPLLIAAGFVLALAWVGMRFFMSDDHAKEAPAPQAAVQEQGSSRSLSTAQPQSAPPAPTKPLGSSATNDSSAGAAASNDRRPSATGPAAAGSVSPSALVHEVLPAIPQSAMQTIRGTIKISVLVDVDAAGNVIAANSRLRGPSRYFERLCVEAAKQWTFGPTQSTEPRQMLVMYTLKRSGVTAEAAPLE